ncbi:type II toxin-antitoxin system VapC family toxin [Botrimarina mediterranea]|uniref:Ribonuclease VapC26 n=1 Tax=Botrimarina mediterranea TaxID=2528022 RepID=A0A518KAT4_9BACT|nr:PIN domain-containing protein [Botrimarina mediterranea]QDV74905.1 Ribonuclease VapC26 [Botrimarina mediterranea]QDV79548.1 Ribonuclease VapC26 [Planctomycetes bacterium K2D]
MTRNIAIVDTGPLVALFDGADIYHHETVNFLAASRRKHVTTLAVVTESVYLLRFNKNAQIDFLEWLQSPAVEIETLEDADLARAIEVMQKYSDLPADFADATLVAIADRLGVNEVVLFDSDFDIYRRGDGAPFIRLPA